MNNFEKAEKAHLAPPDDPEGDWELCEECDGKGEIPHDCGSDTCCCIDPDPIICSNCDGDGNVFVPQLTREEYAERYEDDE